MSFEVLNSNQRFERLSPTMSNALGQNKHIKVLIPYDGSETGDAALDDLRRAGLPQALDAMVAVTNVWLPLSPYEITRAASARRMMVLTAGMSSFAPSLRDYEEQRALSVAAEHRIQSIFPSGTIMTEAMQDTAAVANEILRTAKKWGADLIMVGSKTSTSPDITDYAGPVLKVAQEAHCSVRIARPSKRKDDSLIRILIGVDGSDSAAQVVQSVAQRVWPQESGAHLIAIRKGGPRTPKTDSQVTMALEQSAEQLRAVGLRVSTAIREGQPQEVLLREARELSADCIFIDARGLQPALGDGVDRGGLSKAAVAVVLGAHCSVELVRPKYLLEEDSLDAQVFVTRTSKRRLSGTKMKKQAKKPVSIYITEPDYHRLSGLIEITRERNGVDKEYLNKLEAELDRAEIVDPKHVPADVITMRSKVRLKDLVSGEANTYSLVFPKEADFSEGKISILAPIGTAILGYKLGDTIEWPVPSGLRRLRVDDILYQPEAAGDYEL